MRIYWIIIDDFSFMVNNNLTKGKHEEKRHKRALHNGFITVSIGPDYL